MDEGGERLLHGGVLPCIRRGSLGSVCLVIWRDTVISLTAFLARITLLVGHLMKQPVKILLVRSIAIAALASMSFTRPSYSTIVPYTADFTETGSSGWHTVSGLVTLNSQTQVTLSQSGIGWTEIASNLPEYGDFSVRVTVQSPATTAGQSWVELGIAGGQSWIIQERLGTIVSLAYDGFSNHAVGVATNAYSSGSLTLGIARTGSTYSAWYDLGAVDISLGSINASTYNLLSSDTDYFYLAVHDSPTKNPGVLFENFTGTIDVIEPPSAIFFVPLAIIMAVRRSRFSIKYPEK
jgi:hypothetical protein